MIGIRQGVWKVISVRMQAEEGVDRKTELGAEVVRERITATSLERWSGRPQYTPAPPYRVAPEKVG